jgi:hypothetical protein
MGREKAPDAQKALVLASLRSVATSAWAPVPARKRVAIQNRTLKAIHDVAKNILQRFGTRSAWGEHNKVVSCNQKRLNHGPLYPNHIARQAIS